MLHSGFSGAEMKRTAVALALILALLSSTITGILLVNVAKANYLPPPSLEIFSPISAPCVYPNASVLLNVRVNILPSEPDITCIRYSLDGKANVTITNLAKEENVGYWTSTKGVIASGTAFSAKVFMDNLADGAHMLVVYARYANGKEMSRSREFTVDTNYKPYTPELAILSPQNQTYSTAEVPLTFAVNEPILHAHYMLDRHDPFLFLSGDTELTGNSTLTDLSNGMHNITITVVTERGSTSQTTYFSININETSTTNPDPTIPVVVAGSIGATATVGFGLMVYFKKRKRETGDEE
jgi:hypothetical protein